MSDIQNRLCPVAYFLLVPGTLLKISGRPKPGTIRRAIRRTVASYGAALWGRVIVMMLQVLRQLVAACFQRTNEIDNLLLG